MPTSSLPTAQLPRRSSWLGVAALLLGATTLVVAVGILSYAAVRYVPIARATSISAGEGPGLTWAQQQVSVAVVHFKILSLELAFILGIATLVLSVLAIALRRGPRYAKRALVVLLVGAITTILMWMFAFPIIPCLGNPLCHSG